MKTRRTPSKWTIPLTGTAGLFGAFAAYLFLLVPILEGQSAAGIPKVDPLGIFKSENTGQWISLFPAQSWQRDENQRNIIQADGNILIFQDYHEQSDGTLKVTRLCLLLFDQENRAADGNYDLNGHDYPTVVEAIDGAVLTFDESRPLAIGKYGPLQNIEFLGQVRFWKQSSDPQKQMALNTQKLVITGQNATTSHPVQFQFGDSIGQADGLELVFENPDLQQTMQPALTRIEGIALARFGRIRHLEFQLPKKKEAELAEPSLPARQQDSRIVELKCDGRAEFLFDQHVANFHDRVEVTDVKRGYRMQGHFLQVQFAAEPSSSESRDKASEFLPKGLKARQIRAQGNPLTGQVVVVSELKSQTVIEAPQLSYDLAERMMVASTSILDKPSQRFPSVVRLRSEDMLVEVPNLRYRGVENQDSASPQQLGEIWAQGAGRLTRQAPDGPLQVTWTDQVTVLDDRDMKDRKVVSFYGNARARDHQDFDIQAERIHFWLRRLESLDGRGRHAPDLILAQDNVQFQTNELYGQVQQARVYFPQQATQPLTLSARPHPVGGALGQTKTEKRVIASRPRLETDRKDVAATRPETLPWVQADQLVLSLTHADPASSEASIAGDDKEKKPKYEPGQLQLQGGVSIVEAHWVNRKIQPVQAPEYTLKGEDISGQHQGKDGKGKAQFLWKISGNEKQDATIETPKGYFQSQEVHLDQAGNRVWSRKSGLLRFPVEMSGQLLDNAKSEEEESEESTGQGTLRWTRTMNFDGRSFFADGDIRCDIEQTSSKTNRRIQGNADKIQLDLDRQIKFENQKSERPPELLNLKLESVEPGARPVRLYQQEFTPQGQLTSQDVIWSPRVQLDRQSEKVHIAGQGKLWSVRKARPKKQTIQQVAHQETTLDYIEVEFDQSMVGDLDAGQFTFHGPVRSIHGTATDWQVDNPYQDLLDLIQLDCNTLVLNRWRLDENDDYEMEMEAAGSVHVVGTQFESLAERLRYNKRQDLLTIEGDTRNAARFWQDNPNTGKRNQAIAQKIWYYPKSRRFNLEGLKGGDLTFTAGTATPPTTKSLPTRR